MNKETELQEFTENFLRSRTSLEGAFGELSDLFYALCDTLEGEVREELLTYWNVTSDHMKCLLDRMNQVIKK